MISKAETLRALEQELAPILLANAIWRNEHEDQNSIIRLVSNRDRSVGQRLLDSQLARPHP